ncbi:alpha/beta hydrolase [Phytohabitans rumicis]|uniref:Hydrolase n=1 Tax=Phytohabitans rumicis TaxID=1076125 RepID=A0A6V8LK74_9ACTN|nr:alpha/beta hydrolase [Phytohabitans rumicis]GFJ95341.1 hydrolase [Phytohabitans rumicis]
MRVLAVVLAGAMVLAPAGAVAGPASGPAVPSLVWRACAPDLPGFECATAQVPLDYDRPRGAQITLALTRLPATDKARRIGSLFLNPGGPGGSGVDFVQIEGKRLYTAEVRARFDLVGFDPRGIARSTPVQCFDTTDEALAALPPFAFPFTRAEERAWIASNRTYAAACARRAGPIIDHMSTANVARDLDLLRRAVGDRKMTFAGYSYGSYIGSTYANMFPDRVRAVIVDGVIDPVSFATGRGDQARTLPVDARLVSEQGAYATLLEFLRLCDRGGDNCAFSAGDPKRRYDRLAKRLQAQALTLPDGAGGTITFGYHDLVASTLGALFDPFIWPVFADLLQQIDTLAQPAAAAEALRALRARLGQPGRRAYEQVQEGFAGVTCADTDNPDHVSAWARAARRADQKYPYFGRIWNWGSSICAFWPGRDGDRYTGPFNRRTANTVLVIGNRFDPATRYQDAVSTARMLPRSSLITVEGWGHTSLFLSSCVDGHVSRYLLTGQAPGRRVVCGVDAIPFAGTTSRDLAGDELSDRGLHLVPPVLRLGR